MLEDAIQQVQALSAGTALIFLFFTVIPLILSIILFFKVWIMTDDISRIKEWIDLEHPYVDDGDKEKTVTP